MDEHGLTWLPAAPKIKLLPDHNRRRPHPLSWEEQDRLFRELPRHLANMALFAVNTGCRDREICQLRWQWEVVIPELSARVFIIPGEWVKNSDDRLVVLNKTAESVVDSVRGEHAEYSSPTTDIRSIAYSTRRGRPLGRGLSFRRCACTTSNIPLGADSGRPGCRLKIGKTCWDTAPVGLPRITVRPSWSGSSKPRTKCAKWTAGGPVSSCYGGSIWVRSPAKFPHVVRRK